MPAAVADPPCRGCTTTEVARYPIQLAPNDPSVQMDRGVRYFCLACLRDVRASFERTAKTCEGCAYSSTVFGRVLGAAETTAFARAVGRADSIALPLAIEIQPGHPHQRGCPYADSGR